MFLTLVSKSTFSVENGDTQINVLAPNSIFEWIVAEKAVIAVPTKAVANQDFG
jgi:hypothetical protein